MTATSEKQGRNGTATAPRELRPATTVTPKARRRPALIVAGVAMAALGALAVMWLVSSTSKRVDVVVMARDVAYGSTLAVEDLATTAASIEPTVAAVAAEDLDELVGLVATTDLNKGSLLTRADVAPGGAIAPDEVLVPLPLVAEKMPAGGLHAGDQVLVVDTPPVGADPAATAPETVAARVVRVGVPDVNGSVVLDVVTPAKDGPKLAVRAATGRFALVVQPAQVAP